MNDRFSYILSTLFQVILILTVGIYIGKVIAFSQIYTDCDLMKKSRHNGNVIACNLVIENGGVK